MAAQENHLEVVQFLLDNGSSQSIATEVTAPERTAAPMTTDVTDTRSFVVKARALSSIKVNNPGRRERAFMFLLL